MTIEKMSTIKEDWIQYAQAFYGADKFNLLSKKERIEIAASFYAGYLSCLASMRKIADERISENAAMGFLTERSIEAENWMEHFVFENLKHIAAKPKENSPEVH